MTICYFSAMLAGLVEDFEARVKRLQRQYDEAHREVESSENLIKDDRQLID